MKFAEGGILYFDHSYDGAGDIPDEEFTQLFMTRDPKSIAPSDWPPADGVVVQAEVQGRGFLAINQDGTISNARKRR